MNRVRTAARGWRCGVVAAGLLTAGAACAQSAGEQAFEGARSWTVQIRASVNQPFIEDQLGSHHGAGLLVDAGRGWVLTNAHVATHSHAALALAFVAGESVRAERLYVDPHLDLAVLRFDPRALPAGAVTPELECDTLPPVGHPVGAFGHPWGFRFTGTRGITSAVTSRLGATMLQTDAPINAGNSGGPLISLDTGRVVGVNAAKIASEEVEGLSFAVPMPYACTILRLLQQGRDPAPPAALVDFAIDEHGDQTLTVARTRLPPGTLDLRVGDEIQGVAGSGRDAVTPSDLFDALRGHLGAMALSVRRNGELLTISGSWPKPSAIVERSGLRVSGALFAEAESLVRGHLVGDYALMVHHVAPGSESEVREVASYDVLVSADGAPVPSLEVLAAASMRARAAQRPLQLILLRFAGEDSEQLFEFQLRALPVDEVSWAGAVP